MQRLCLLGRLNNRSMGRRMKSIAAKARMNIQKIDEKEPYDPSSSSLSSNSASSSSSYNKLDNSKPLKFYLETFGCQMNVNDSQIVKRILLDAGHLPIDDVEKADLILANTCAIRDNAEAKIWHRLKYFESIGKKRKHNKKQFLLNRINNSSNNINIEEEQQKYEEQLRLQKPPLVGVLGCMAERLKDQMFEQNNVNFVAGPDAYRDIPHLINSVTNSTDTNQRAANTQLSLDETYADIQPVREASDLEAFVSIMRGCNNMCSYCIVPFTRGRERSRPISSILHEVDVLVEKGIKEIMFLGQNVNSYHDKSDEAKESYSDTNYEAADGFKNMYKIRNGAGARFAELLDAASAKHPEIRFRFTSPHPKDFSTKVLTLISERPNICSCLHMPAQSGSTTVLERMRRGYSRESYLELIARAREMIPGLAISTDMIVGFCGETEEEHVDTITLMEQVKFDQAYMFAYSLRDKTHAARNYYDDVPAEIKSRRLKEIIDTFRSEVQRKNEVHDLHTIQLVLVEGEAKKSKNAITPIPSSSSSSPSSLPMQLMSGRTDSNKRCLFVNNMIPDIRDEHVLNIINDSSNDSSGGDCTHVINDELIVQRLQQIGSDVLNSSSSSSSSSRNGDTSVATSKMFAGDYVAVYITEVKGHTLRGVPIAKASIASFEALKQL